MKNNRIIHICNDYSKQSLYRSLFLSLSKHLNQQIVYVPVRSKDEIGKYLHPSLQVIQSHILNPLDRIFFRKKIKKIRNNFLLHIPNLSSRDIIHAHFLYSDGAVALSLKKDFKIKYLVTVRNTDLNYFFKLRPDLYFLMIEILKNAERVIFLNFAYKDRLLKLIPKKNRDLLIRKFSVIPNGLDEHWLENSKPLYEPSKIIRLLYVGDFSKNKNVHLVIKAAIKLSQIGFNISLKLAGGGGNYHKKIIQLVSKHEDICEYLGHVNASDLKIIYGTSDILIVPSKHETFGLVFIEALSQGCKLIYTEGEAISGLIEDSSIALGLRKLTSSEIANKIIELNKNTDSSRERSISFSKQFSLNKLSLKYIKIYKQA